MMEKIAWTDLVKNKEVLRRVEEEMYILQRIKRRKDNRLVTSCVETVFYNTLLKERWKDGSERKTRKKTSEADGRP
jgi:hypothetical protein